MGGHERPTNGTIAWLDLDTAAVEPARRFYGKLLGWTFLTQQTPVGEYHVAQVGGRDIAGILARDGRGRQRPASWTVFIEVEDLETTLETAVAAGGRVLAPAMRVPGGARVAVLADPAGAMFALIESPAEAWTLVQGEPGGLYFAEVLSRDAARAIAFYERTFGWKPDTRETGGTHYTLFMLDDKPVAGLMAMPAEVPGEAPSHWMVYFTVTDVEEATRAVPELGGVVAHGPTTIAAGRFALVSDPGGAMVGLIEPSDA